MDSKTLRLKFIDFFESRGHKILPSSSLVPENDPSVLFTTAGMQQFKRYYTYPEEALAKNVVTVQPCVRTSDIEEVGDDTHLTFFEMLGNFSFAGYGKKEAIEMAEEFLSKELAIDSKRIWCSIFAGDRENPRDSESAEILKKMGFKVEEHGREDNFWGPTGDEGPCGPTVEFYVDDIEIWNLVFNEYYLEKAGNYKKLEKSGVDTGMGLERALVVVNQLKNIYETDLFEPIIGEIEQQLPLKKEIDNKNIRIISDHIKTAVFLINSGVAPGNKRQNATVRRLIRLAVQRTNWVKDNDWVRPLVEKIFEIYQYYSFDEKENIILEINKEVDRFNSILNFAQKNLSKKPANQYNIDKAFFLFQSEGIPFEIYNDYAAMQGVKLDKEAFYEKLKKHQELSRVASSGMFKGGLASGGKQEIKYHTATHLLLAALRIVLGPYVAQKGSNITSERLRFDFSHPQALSPDELSQVEDLVNQQIKNDLHVEMKEMNLDDARKCGAIGEFGHKYGFKVKVYTIGPSTSSGRPFSVEICGGPHVKHTGVLGHFKIIKKESSGAGTRRIKAILE